MPSSRQSQTVEVTGSNTYQNGDNAVNVLTLVELSKTLALLTQEVLNLRQQITTLKAQHTTTDAELETEITNLIAENTRLKQSQALLLKAYNQLLENKYHYSTQQQEARGHFALCKGEEEVSGRALLAEGKVLSSPCSELRAPMPLQSVPAGSAQQRAMRIFLALKQWNHQYPNRSFAFTKRLLEREWRIHPGAVKQFFTAYQDDICHYHDSIGVVNSHTHNRQKGRNLHELKAFIRDRL
ncbi:hypothetical protein [Fischerella sp. PCC 9605]|uniref:hypothetical protein n=1 Tax=Fischerella sp. PCC 9605 TaxID=1173024 RepID=UPI0018CC7B6F|nr:hypothetical protein [Fischerella sp. PCC 9605]